MTGIFEENFCPEAWKNFRLVSHLDVIIRIIFLLLKVGPRRDLDGCGWFTDSVCPQGQELRTSQDPETALVTIL